MSAIDVSTPVIVLGIDTQIGLSIIRELGRAGIPVHGVTADPRSIGLRSRYLARGHVIAEKGVELVDRLAALGRALGKAYLIAVAEHHLLLLSSHRERLAPVNLLCAPRQALDAALDKSHTLRLARECGIDTPRTWSVPTWESVEALGDDLSFPIVLKWADPNAAARALEPAGLELHKAEYADDIAGLRRALGRYRGVGMYPLIQEYVAGEGIGQFIFMHRGKAIRTFQHRRVREWPPEGGFSTACDALPLSRFSDLMAKSVALLARMGWEGVAMVEYRHDPATGRSALMEINGRFWGSLPLAYWCGAGFALLTYAVLGNGELPELPPCRTDLRCRVLGVELKRLARIVLQPGRIRDRRFPIRPIREIVNFLADTFRPNVRYYVFAPDDPLPFLRDVANALLRRS